MPDGNKDTTIRVKEANAKRLKDYMHEHRLNSMDSALYNLFDEIEANKQMKLFFEVSVLGRAREDELEKENPQLARIYRFTKADIFSESVVSKKKKNEGNKE